MSDSYSIGTPYRSEGGTWKRGDFYLPTGSTDTVFVAGPDDRTPHQAHGYPEHDYDARCSCCWLHITHSVAKHTASLIHAIAAEAAQAARAVRR